MIKVALPFSTLAIAQLVAVIPATLLLGCAKAQTVPSPQAACTIATAQVTEQRRLPTSHVAFCDHVPYELGHQGYYVMALRAHCHEDICGSTNMGWFAVEKTTGLVFEIDDVAGWTPGRRVTDG